MTHLRYTLATPNGTVIGAGEKAVIERLFARMVEREGFPLRGSYTMREHWKARVKFKGTQDFSRLYLGCDKDGWFELDRSGVPTTAAPAKG